MDVAERVVAVLAAHPGVTRVELVGSRADGTANPLSDWDFRIEATDVDALVRELPRLVEPLTPLATQWDRLADRAVYMLMLPGGVKVDLFPGDVPHAIGPPWQPEPANLSGIDAHFWDWILWLGSKVLGGRSDLVADEMEKLHVNVLGPLGAELPPRSVGEAVEQFLDLRAAAETRLDVVVDRRMGDEVIARLEDEGLLD